MSCLRMWKTWDIHGDHISEGSRQKSRNSLSPPGSQIVSVRLMRSLSSRPAPSVRPRPGGSQAWRKDRQGPRHQGDCSRHETSDARQRRAMPILHSPPQTGLGARWPCTEHWLSSAVSLGPPNCRSSSDCVVRAATHITLSFRQGLATGGDWLQRNVVCGCNTFVLCRSGHCG